MGTSRRLLERGDELLDRAAVVVGDAHAAVGRANRQLDQAAAVTASMEELGTGMSELAGQVNALAGFGRTLTAGPVARAAAVAYGIRHATALRRSRRGALPVQAVKPGEVIERGVIR
jgi:hypothetical protein